MVVEAEDAPLGEPPCPDYHVHLGSSEVSNMPLDARDMHRHPDSHSVKLVACNLC